jgi:transcriptional regulator with GAF, ATPase, and Fis domain
MSRDAWRNDDERVDREQLQRASRQVARAARLLQVRRHRLQRLLQRLGLLPDALRRPSADDDVGG